MSLGMMNNVKTTQAFLISKDLKHVQISYQLEVMVKMLEQRGLVNRVQVDDLGLYQVKNSF